MNPKINAKAVNGNEIKAVNKKKCGETASGRISQKRLAGSTSARKGEVFWVAWPKSLLWESRLEHWASGHRVPGLGLV